MRRAKRVGLAALALALAAGPAAQALAQAPAAGGTAAAQHRRNFRTAIYVVVNATRQLADPATFERQFDRAMRQVRFDKVYIEVYRNRQFATDDEIERVKRYFTSRGVQVSGGITLAAGDRKGQFGTFDYEDPKDRAECDKAVRLAARHFDEVVLDDFFFYTTKSEADIAAKGDRSWTRYRLETMRKVARDLVLGPAHQVNPRIRMRIKYPNWYEHFEGLGFDLDQEAHAFDGIYTGTETRDPEITDQLLQPYESYEVIRYYDNIRPDPGGNGGGWVDTYSTRSVDRYAEQLWDTLLAKAPEITLFNWAPMSETKPLEPGERPWSGQATSFDWDAMRRSYRPGAGRKDPGPGWGAAAGYALDRIDTVLGALGRPVGLASYRPPNSSSTEDFLHNYLGDVGLPIELSPTFPAAAPVVLLTEAARTDPDITAKIKRQLVDGKTVVITSGLLGALQDRGIKDVVEAYPTGRVIAPAQFYDGFGAGNGQRLDDAAHPGAPVLMPEVHFFTNDAWAVIRGVADRKGAPVLLMDRYANGVIYVLTVPENMGDLYALPQGVLTRIKAYIQPDAPVRLDAPAHVSLFTYDNDSLVVQSFRDEARPVVLSVKGRARALRDVATGRLIAPRPPPPPRVDAHGRELDADQPTRTEFELQIAPHSYQAFAVQR